MAATPTAIDFVKSHLDRCDVATETTNDLRQVRISGLVGDRGSSYGSRSSRMRRMRTAFSD